MEEFIFDLADGYGNKVSFTSIEHLEAFVSDEKEHWSWVTEAEIGRHGVSDRFRSTFTDIDSWIEQFKRGALDGSGLRANLTGAYQARRPHMLFFEFAPGATVESIRQSYGVEQAALALEILLGVVPQDLADWNQARIWAMLALPSSIEPTAWVERERQELARAKDRLRRELGNHQKKLAEQQSKLAESNEKARLSYRKIAQRVLRRARERADAIADNARASIEQINATDAAYTQHMALKAPVAYWKTKGQGHRTAAIVWGIAMVLYVAAAIGVGVWLFGLAWAEASGEAFTGKTFLLATGIGTVLTLIFWVSRVLMRIFLGELHLYTDAEERRVMTETYLALIKENGASENERALILAALFRTAQDGIVREEVGGEVGLAAILAKLLDGRR